MAKIKIISKKGAKSMTQFTKNDDGMSSGHAAEMEESSCIALKKCFR